MGENFTSILGVAHSESKAIYENADRLVEKWCKRMVFISAKIVRPFLIAPTAVQCYFTYFTTDLGAAAFELPIPIW